MTGVGSQGTGQGAGRRAPGIPPRETPGEARSAGDGGATRLAERADRHAGARIRERRMALGMSQQQLARLIGVTYQQAHKYERGVNRISAGRLFAIACALEAPVAWFFEGLDQPADAAPPVPRRCLELARQFERITDARQLEALSRMVRALAGETAA